MRFGIITMQREAIIPPGLTDEEAFAHLANFDIREVVRGMAEAGFRIIEIGGDLSLFMPHTFATEAISSLAVIKEELDLTYTVHLPLWSVEPATPLEPVRRGSAQAVLENLRATSPLDPEVYVLHATGALAAEFYRMDLPDLAKAIVMKQFQAKAKESLAWILEESGLESRRLAIETVQFPFDLTLEIAESLDLSICLDTGHVLVGFSGPISVEQALEKSLPRLAEVHLHDGPWQGREGKVGYGQDHRTLGQGDLDIAAFMKALEEVNFEGPVIFELQLPEALASMKVIEDLGWAD